MSVQLRDYLINPDDYEVGKQLGKGACGEVFEAKEKATGRVVAMKKLNDLNDPRDQKLFVREVVVPVRLSRLSIVNMLGFRFPEPKGDGTVMPGIIITELMRNGTLKDILQRKFRGDPDPRFGPTEWTKAIYGIAHAMREVHKQGAMHRDLKPENVFLDDNFEIKIADFGLSKLVKDGLQNTLQVGSPIFMAPELMISNDTTYDSSVDVYAYGVLIYQTFTNNLQLSGKGQPQRIAQLMMRVARGDRLKRMSEIPDCWWELIERCWDQVSSNRPTFSDIVELLEEGKLVIPGTDMDRYREYQRRLEAEHVRDEDVKRLLQSTIMRTGTGYGGPPTVADLAMSGDQSWIDLYDKEMTKSMRGEFPNDIRPFPFKRK